MVFKLTPPTSAGGAWKEAVLYGFRASDGWYPAGGVIFDASGALYGTTESGGSLNVGTVFELTPPGLSAGIGRIRYFTISRAIKRVRLPLTLMGQARFRACSSTLAVRFTVQRK
jgi:uncharacterized repeat protein (TIGR03803 family)